MRAKATSYKIKKVIIGHYTYCVYTIYVVNFFFHFLVVRESFEE